MPYSSRWFRRRNLWLRHRMRLRALILYELLFLVCLALLSYLLGLYSTAACELRTPQRRNYFRADEQAAYFKTWLSPGLFAPHFLPSFWEVLKKEDFQVDARRFIRRQSAQGGSWVAATDFGMQIAREASESRAAAHCLVD
eukprot:scaffold831_cov268-Pinguiococcus_pyrenoidosus.AAC.7